MSYRVIQGSAHHIPELADKSVHVICTSPPYMGLRKYDGDQSIEWPTVEYSPMPGLPPIRIQGCEPGCAHEWVDGAKKIYSGGQGKSTINDTADYQGSTMFATTQGAYCIHCGGWKGGLGLEGDVFSYIGHLMLVMREMYRVLRNDGTVWFNIGSSYAGSGGAHTFDHANPELSNSAYRNGAQRYQQAGGRGPVKGGDGIKPKDDMLIPARFALAAQADGWYVRSAMPWIKRNGMPESVTDRPSQVVEWIFLLSKSEKYFFDMESIKQPVAEASIGRLSQDIEHQTGTARANGGAKTNGNQKAAGSMAGRNFRSSDLFFKTWQGLLSNEEGDPLAMVVNPRPFSGAHFACFPELIPEIAVKSGSSQYGCCAKCQAPWERVLEREVFGRDDKNTPDDGPRDAGIWSGRAGEVNTHTTGWRPTCSCQCDDVTPCVVLDPFVGSGTTIRTALSLGRNAIGVDMSDAYLGDLVPKRASNVQMQLAL